MIDERLAKFLSKGTNWERKPTSIPGVFLLKLPAFKDRSESIVIEINPVDTSGSPTKKRGIIIRTSYELDQIRNILADVKLKQLTKSIDEENPEVMTTAGGTSDIYEI